MRYPNGLTERDLILQRLAALKNERASWDAHYREIGDYLLPRAGRFLTSDRNKGDKRHNNIYDNTATRGLDVLAAGLMAGMTSPARPWFRLATTDEDLAQYAPVKLWLSKVTRLMQAIFSRSNTYRVMHSLYEELGAFGTASTVMLPDFDNVIHHHANTVGEYFIATDYRGNVDTIYREFELTVGALVKEFGIENVSSTVKNLWDTGKLDQWVPVVHVIEPRTHREYGKRDAKNMPWKSCYFELARSGEDKFLRESGYREFRALCPRWVVRGRDVYGESPAMNALGDIKQLQHEQLRKGQAIDYQTKPPLQVPTSLKEAEVNTLPGGTSYYDAANPNGGIRAAFEVNLRLDYLLDDIRDVRDRINGAFYVDLFLMLANDRRSNVTATEIAERHEEKLLMLGPVLERLHNELLSPKIDMTFARMLEAGIVPPAPPELQGQDLNVEFVSMLAQAQRAVATNAVDRYVANLGQIAQFKPDVLDKFDADEWADAYGDMLGVDPTLIVPDEQVAIIRQQRAEAQATAAQDAAMAQRAETVSKLAGADTSGNNALTDVMQMFSGYSTPA